MDLWDRAEDKSNNCAAHVEDPAVGDRTNETPFAEALDPEGQGKTSPGSDKVLGLLPEEDSETSAHDTSNSRCQ